MSQEHLEVHELKLLILQIPFLGLSDLESQYPRGHAHIRMARY